MAQTWYVIRGDIETQVSGGSLSYRVSANNIGAPPKRNLSTRGPFQQGETFYGFRYDKRVMSLVFYAESTSLALADGKRDDIYNLWRGIENETVTVKVVRDDGATRLIDGEVVNIIDFPDSINDRFGTAQSFAVQLECHNPFWRKETKTVVVLPVNATTTVQYNGQVPAEPIINIVGQVTDPVLTQVFTGKKIDFTGSTIVSGQNYLIDTRYGYKTALDKDLVNVIDKLTNDSNLGDFNVYNFPQTRGVTWTAVVAAEQNAWRSVAYGNGVWIAVSQGGTNRVMRSTNDGVTWTAVVAAEQNQWFSVAYGNGIWVAVAIDGTNQVMRSIDDGVTWTTVVAAEQNGWISVAYGNGVWVAVAISGTNRVMRSTNDGVTWTAVVAAEQNVWRSVAYGNGVWIAVAETGTNRVMRESDVSQKYTVTGTGIITTSAVVTMTYNELYLGL